MLLSSRAPNAPGRQSLSREIAAILGFKLLALVLLYFLFFDQRPHITSGSIERHVLDQSAPIGTSHD